MKPRITKPLKSLFNPIMLKSTTPKGNRRKLMEVAMKRKKWSIAYECHKELVAYGDLNPKETVANLRRITRGAGISKGLRGAALKQFVYDTVLQHIHISH